MVCIARWESAGGKHWAELYRCFDAKGRTTSYSYRSNNGGGCLGPVSNPAVTVESTVTVMQVRVDSGWFLPDRAVLPMKRVA